MQLDHSAHIESHLKNLVFNVWNPIEKIKLLNPSFAYNLQEVQSTFKILHLGLNFVSDLSHVGK